MEDAECNRNELTEILPELRQVGGNCSSDPIYAIRVLVNRGAKDFWICKHNRGQITTALLAPDSPIWDNKNGPAP